MLRVPVIVPQTPPPPPPPPHELDHSVSKLASEFLIRHWEARPPIGTPAPVAPVIPGGPCGPGAPVAPVALNAQVTLDDRVKLAVTDDVEVGLRVVIVSGVRIDVPVQHCTSLGLIVVKCRLEMLMAIWSTGPTAVA